MNELFNEIDQDRIGFLFSSFPLERTSLNALQFDSKLLFWQENIKKYLKETNKVTFESKEILQVFRHSNQIPLCFDRVLAESAKNGMIINLDYFQSSIVFRVLMFPFKNFSSNSIYIHLELLQELAQQIASNAPALILKEDLISNIKDLNLSEKENQLILLVLTKQTFTEQNQIYSKTNQFPQKEINLLKIQKSKNILSLQIKEIDQKITKKNIEIKKNLNNKKMAIVILKQKKILEEIHLKRWTSLHTIENILLKIEQSESDIDILNSFKLGSDLLKNILEHEHLKEDFIDNVFDELRVHIERQNDIEKQIGGLGKDFGVLDEQSFEKELDDIVRKEKELEAMARKEKELDDMVRKEKENLGEEKLLDQLAALSVANTPIKIGVSSINVGTKGKNLEFA